MSAEPTYTLEENRFDLRVTHAIRAPKDVTYQVLADFESYPHFITDIVSASYQGNSVYELKAKAAVLTIPARIRVEEDPPQEVYFELLDGPVDVIEGRWLVRDGQRPGESEVELVVHVEASGRSQWLLRMAGQYVQTKSGKLIDSFSNRVEAVLRGDISPAPRPEPNILQRLLERIASVWRWVTGRAPARQPEEKTGKVFTTDHQLDTLEALAETMIPADEFDEGVRGLGFSGVAEMRARYEQGKAHLYLTALAAVDEMAQERYGKDAFVSLDTEERTALLAAIRQSEGSASWQDVEPSDFFSALWEDSVFLYTTHPETWKRIGWPGPSYDTGGYPDFDQPQTFLGKDNDKEPTI